MMVEYFRLSIIFRQVVYFDHWIKYLGRENDSFNYPDLSKILHDTEYEIYTIETKNNYNERIMF